MRKGRPQAPGALLLAPGAGSSRDHPTLTGVERAVAPLPVGRMDFPYRKAGRRAPDRAPVLLEAVREEAAALVAATRVAPEALLLGGRSMGGRMCSMVVADGLPAAGLVLLSYPLHPPGRPDKLRIEHLPALDVPVLFVSGTNDPFATPDELVEHAGAIRGPVTFVWVEGAGHEWKRRDDEIAAVVAAWIAGAPVPERLEKPASRS
ncbi:MAG: dienelactone hydrolase family protein [Acidimicrobiia bacterium]|nr:dienelactone hydrolase family protein [Acidimicrobiia bacterium]